MNKDTEKKLSVLKQRITIATEGTVNRKVINSWMNDIVAICRGVEIESAEDVLSHTNAVDIADECGIG